MGSRELLVLYAKRPVAAPDQILNYLGRYTHRVSPSNDRLLPADTGPVRFEYKDYADGSRHKFVTLCAPEFIRRLLHVLHAGFMCIRHCGIVDGKTRQARCARIRA